MIRSPLAALVVLTLINLFNYIDRYVVPAIQPRIKSALELSDSQLGLLSSSFVIVYSITSPFFGRLGDTRSRTGLIALGVAIWSFATAGAGLARTFALMFALRALVGVGEAAYGTIAPSLLADYYPKAMRGRIFAIFYAAIPVGSALGYVLGGFVEKRWGWDHAFFVAGLPGIALAGLALLVRDPPRGAHDPEDAAHAHAMPDQGFLAACATLWRNRPYVLTVAGYAAYTFAVGGLAVWMPTFLERVRKVPLEQANQTFGAITVVSGFVGTLAGGWLADGLQARGYRNPYLLVSGWATVLAVPAAALALLVEEPARIYFWVFVAELLLFATTGPINSLVVTLVPTNMRATAVAMSILAIHVLGDAISPPIIGVASDHFGLGSAVFIVPLAVVVAGAIWTTAALAREAAPAPAGAPPAA